MRVVFRVEKDIPELAEAGDLVAVFLDGRERPVVRMTHHAGDAALGKLARFRGHLSHHHPPGAALELLRGLLPPPVPIEPGARPHLVAED